MTKTYPERLPQPRQKSRDKLALLCLVAVGLAFTFVYLFEPNWLGPFK
jgi:hypothetical protein